MEQKDILLAHCSTYTVHIGSAFDDSAHAALRSAITKRFLMTVGIIDMKDYKVLRKSQGASRQYGNQN